MPKSRSLPKIAKSCNRIGLLATLIPVLTASECQPPIPPPPESCNYLSSIGLLDAMYRAPENSVAEKVQLYNAGPPLPSSAAIQQSVRIRNITPLGDAAAVTIMEPVTAGAAKAALKSIFDELINLVKTTTGELKSVLTELQASIGSIMEQLDVVFKDNMDVAFEKMTDQQKLLFNSARATVFATQNAINDITSKATEDALVTLWESSIVAYDAEYNLPLRDHPPRIVYADPRDVRLSSTGSSDSALNIKVRGNYLAIGRPSVTVDGTPAEIKGLNQHEFFVGTPASVVSRLADAKSDQILEISAALPKCDGRTVTQAQAIKVRTPISYAVAARITPTAEVPIEREMDFRYEDVDEKCDQDRRSDQLFTVPPHPR